MLLVATHEEELNAVTEESQDEGDLLVATIRLPASLGTSERRHLLEGCVSDFRPDWISLQYVPYSFAENGIPWQFALTLRHLSGSAKFEIMFHELWLRHRAISDVKGRSIGAAQRFVTLRIAKVLRPEVIHTHIPINRDELTQNGFDVSPLPLFANIGYVEGATAAGTEKDHSAYRVAFFSRLESPPPVQRVLTAIADWCLINDRKLEVALLGGGKAKVASAAEAIRAAVPTATVLPVGYLSAEGVSAWLTTCDLALTPIPRHSLGKSGTVAAFLEHGLPVIAPISKINHDPFFRTDLNRSVLDSFDPQGVKEASASLTHGKIELENLQRITARFINDLSLIGSPVGNAEGVSSNSQS